MLAFGGSNVLWKKLPEKNSIFHLISRRTIVTAGIFLALYLFVYFLSASNVGIFSNFTPFEYWQPIHLTLGAGVCFYSFFGLYFYNKSIRLTSVSNTVITTSSSSLFGVLIGIVGYNESLQWNHFATALLFIAAISLLQKNPLSLNKGTKYALLAGFIWGTSFATLPFFARNYGPLSTSLLLELMVLLASFLLTPKKQPKLKKENLSVLIILGILTTLGVFLFNLAMVYADVSVLSLLGILSPLVSVALSALILKENITWKLIIALTLSVLGLLFLKLQ